MKKIHLLTLSITLTLLGCQGFAHKENPESIKTKSTATFDGHTAETSLDWDGTYKGLLPCASCPGILTTVKLNADKTFVKSDFYLESKEGYLNDKGVFSFSEDGGKVILKSNKGTTIYAVGENKLILLDKDGKAATSTLAEMYKLTKLDDQDIEFTNKPIKGLLTFGHEVSVFEPLNSAKTYWINDFKDARLTKLYHNTTGNQSAPYTPVVAELVLKDNNNLKQGFAEQYDGVVDVINIKSVERITPTNYNYRSE
ncbi:MAG: hypothetical protein CSA42_06425 [Gammaproteobacteria bacterium]|nr:MAG: hypothetical protein CSA42_06425 [Gammaproteobacteria bacterium]